MPKNDHLTLYEEILLLALKDEKGTTEIGSHYNLAMGGAILAELLLLGRIRTVQEKKKRFAVAASTKTTGDELLDDALRRISESKKRQQLKTWVSRFSNLKHLKRRAARQLCRKGVLRESEDRVLLIFRRTIYPELNPRPERALVGRLRRAVLTGTGRIDPRTLVIVALAFHTDLLKNVLPKRKLKERKKRIEQLASGEAVGAATKEAVQAVEAAAAMAAIMPAITVAATTSS